MVRNSHRTNYENLLWCSNHIGAWLEIVIGLTMKIYSGAQIILGFKYSIGFVAML